MTVIGSLQILQKKSGTGGFIIVTYPKGTVIHPLLLHDGGRGGGGCEAYIRTYKEPVFKGLSGILSW